MKKLVIASVCGLMLFAACTFAGDVKPGLKTAGAGSMIRVKV